MLNPQRLVILVHVIEAGSVTAAADELGYTPSAVSQQLKKLEREVGQPLVRRQTRGVSPTDAGHTLAHHARKVLRHLDAAEADLRDLTEGNRGSLVVGAFPTVAASFLPEVIETFTSRYPAIDLSLTSGRFDVLLEDLERGVSHLCLLWEYPWRPVQIEGIRLEELFHEESVILVSRDHPLAEAGHVRLEQLRNESWIVRANRHPVVEVLERAAEDAGFRPSIALYANDYQEAQAMVSVGIGVAMAPRGAVAVQHPHVRVLTLGPQAPVRRVLLAQRDERVHTPAEVAFRTILREVARRRQASVDSS
ncbi:LysR family transcriptional regulator [Nesterenkonia aerolata]|uniref:LysR substrate-binding domain-containing protein n=1 Tax=Nesterenkonia aerolata TaxID=3074079 RepID=A0ABU2DRI0_9MICC|nr:LysR substrate-binding domain-containing protein [Nesterenkonia sp. LY-0111]MDR8019113.1 LysR substrate-binding domain-containing protein [Nesterenkonia sp. LY-0111]